MNNEWEEEGSGRWSVAKDEPSFLYEALLSLKVGQLVLCTRRSLPQLDWIIFFWVGSLSTWLSAFSKVSIRIRLIICEQLLKTSVSDYNILLPIKRFLKLMWILKWHTFTKKTTNSQGIVEWDLLVFLESFKSF